MARMILNPDDELVQNIKFRLGVTGGYCPCHPEEIGNADWKCPCKKFREEKECCCELYVEEDIWDILSGPGTSGRG